jgi:uncharacterized metal-binding protein YceD (DUF177 family)
VNRLGKYKIHFIKLKNGVHHFDFDLDKTFFSSFDGSRIDDAKLSANVTLYKDQAHMFDITFQVNGEVKSICDRCLDEFNLPLQTHFNLLVKMTDKEREDEHDITYLPMSAYEIDLSKHLYDVCHLALPIQSKCELAEKKCNTATANKLEELKAENREKIADPRWDKLKELIKTEKNK